jgi:hypothetical protein
MITLRTDSLTFLGELLAPFPEASTWDWLMADVEAAGDPEGARRLHEWSDSGTRVPGADLVGCFGSQIIDGRPLPGFRRRRLRHDPGDHGHQE